MKIKRKNKKGAVLIEMLLMLPLWLFLLLMIFAESFYTKTMIQAEDDARIALRVAVKMSDKDEAIERIVKILETRGHGNLNDDGTHTLNGVFSYRIYEISGTEPIISAEKKWEKGNVLEITTLKYTSMYKKGVTEICVGKVNYIPSRLKCTVTVRMIIELE